MLYLLLERAELKLQSESERVQLTLSSWLICLNSYGWLWGQGETASLLSSFCCLPQRGSWLQLTSAAAGVCGHLVFVFCLHRVPPPTSSSAAKKLLAWSLTLLSPSFTVLRLHRLILLTSEPKAVMNFLAWACTSVRRCALAMCVICVLHGFVWLVPERSPVQTGFLWFTFRPWYQLCKLLKI